MVSKSKLEAFDHLLGEMYDYEIAELAGTLPAAVCKRRKRKGIDPYPIHVLKKYTHLVGLQSDSSISKLSGAAPKTVGDYRRSLGIPKFKSTVEKELLRYDFLFATAADDEIAKIVGCSTATVERRRAKLTDMAKPLKKECDLNE